MSTDNSRFAEFVAECCKVLELEAPAATGDSHMFQVGDRWIELKADDSGEGVSFAAMVYMKPADTEIRADLVASFNVHYLFNGGFSLFFDTATDRLYLCRPHRLDTLEARNIREELIAFADMAAHAGTWYIRSSEEQAAGTRAALPSGETGNFIEV
ncbi:hypothetical protein [Roseibium sp.]|uniref:hypothetical protein n=1 Tax=Roseibium sp. TaxID=1936156 RepID=UPI0032664890